MNRIKTIALAALLFTPLAAMQAAISVNTASAPSGWVTGTGANAITFSPAFSFTPGANGMLMVTVSGEVTPGSPTVTYNGTAMTLAVSTNRPGSGNNGSYASVWYLPSPAVSNGTLAVTTGGTVSRYNVYAVYATGVKQAAPEAVADNTNASALVFETGYITPAASALVVTTLGGSVNASGNTYNSLIFTNNGALAGQTTLAQPATAASISGASYKVVADNAPVKGHGEQTSTAANEAESVVIASFGPAGIDHYAVAASSPQTAGAAFNVTITAQNSTNATVNDSTTTVTVSSPTVGSLMEFDWNTNGTYGDNSGTLVAGVKTIKARNKKAQTVSLVAGDGMATTTTPPSVTTTAGAFNRLQILAPDETAAPGTATGKTGTPGDQTKGINFNVTVNAVDANWNGVNTTDTVRITSTDVAATLPPNAALVAGTKTFAVTLDTLGSFTVTATDVTDGSKTANTTPAITVVNPANAPIPGVNVYDAVPGLPPSDKYSVRLCATTNTTAWKSAFVWQTVSSSTGSNAYWAILTNWSHSYVNFEMTVPVTVEITSLTGSITNAVVHPARKSGGVTITNGKAYVTLNGPCNVAVDINGQMDNQDTGYMKPPRSRYSGPPIHTVSLHANPVLANKPATNSAGVFLVTPGTPPPTNGTWTTLYFLPGVHNIGIAYPVRKGCQYYLPGDAIVYGTFINLVWGAGENSRIFGHGTISMSGIPHPDSAVPPPANSSTYHPIDIRGANNTSVEGITIADPAFHSVMMTAGYSTNKYTLASWVKIFGWRANGDGINPFNNGRISNCFLRTQDDCSYVNGAGINDTVYWNDANGSAFVLTAMPNLTNRTLLVNDCDVIYSRAYWINWSGGRVFNMRGEGGGACGSGVIFSNINITDPRPTMQNYFVSMQLLSPYGSSTNYRDPGDLSGVKFINLSITATNRNAEPEILWGNTNGLASIHNLTFDNLTVGGVTVLTNIFKTNDHVYNLVFTNSTPTMLTGTRVTGGQFSLSFTNNGSYLGLPGTNGASIFGVTNNGHYVVQASTNLAQTNAWVAVSTNTAPFTLTNLLQWPRRYYRLVKP
jgi:hypothetical protein